MRSLTKKYDKNKKYVKEVEKELIKREEKIKSMQLEKKNDDLASMMESNVEAGDNDLGALEYGEPKPHQNNNMLKNPNLGGNIEPEHQDNDGGRKNSLCGLEEQPVMRQNSLAGFEDGGFD